MAGILAEFAVNMMAQLSISAFLSSCTGSLALCALLIITWVWGFHNSPLGLSQDCQFSNKSFWTPSCRVRHQGVPYRVISVLGTAESQNLSKWEGTSANYLVQMLLLRAGSNTAGCSSPSPVGFQSTDSSRGNSFHSLTIHTVKMFLCLNATSFISIFLHYSLSCHLSEKSVHNFFTASHQVFR